MIKEVYPPVTAYLYRTAQYGNMLHFSLCWKYDNDMSMLRVIQAEGINLGLPGLPYHHEIFTVVKEIWYTIDYNLLHKVHNTSPACNFILDSPCNRLALRSSALFVHE